MGIKSIYHSHNQLITEIHMQCITFIFNYQPVKSPFFRLIVFGINQVKPEPPELFKKQITHYPSILFTRDLLNLVIIFIKAACNVYIAVCYNIFYANSITCIIATLKKTCYFCHLYQDMPGCDIL